MRNIFPSDSGIAIDKENGNIATKQDIQDLSNQIDELTGKLNILKNDLLDYEADIASGVNTQAITAISGAIETLSSTSAAISTISAENITASSVANLASILSQAISAANANISALHTSTINSGAIEASSATIGSLRALSAEIDRFSVSNFSTENITSTEIATSNIDVSNKTTTKSFEAETASVYEIIAENASVEELEAEGILSEEIKTSNIVWKDSTTVVHDGIFYMAIPHFENGVYYVQGKKDDLPLFTIEIFNSVDNYFVRWSQKIVGYITNIFKVGTDTDSKLVFKINNLDGDAIQLYNAVETITENVPAPATYETNPYTPEITYSVTYKDGQKFFKLVDLSNDGSNNGVLTMTQTEFYSLADAVSKVYDGTENILRRTYKPNQSLNKTDDVEFNSVSSPFLNVAELDVASKFKTPNIYNGVALTQTKVEELPDGSLYIPLPAETGQTGVGLALFSAKQNMSYYNAIDELLKKYSIDASHLVADENWENYGPYKLTDGYSIDWDTGTAPESIASGAVSMIVADTLNVLYLAIISGESGSYSGGYPCKVLLYPLSGIKVENDVVVLPTPINLKYATATIENNEKILYSDRNGEIYNTDDPRYSDIPWGPGEYRSQHINLGKDGGIALEGREWTAWDPNNNAFFEFTNIFGQVLICSAGSFDYVKVDETGVGTSALYRKSSVGSGTPDVDVEETGYRNAFTDLRLFTGIYREWNETDLQYEILFDSTSEYANIWNWNNGTLSLKEDYSKCELLQLTYSSFVLGNFTSLDVVANSDGSITLTPDVGSPLTVSSSMNGSSSILKVKAVPTTTQVLPLVPYKQSAGNNKPIGYNETEDVFEKIDDVYVAGDLNVDGDTSLADVTADNITVDDTLSADKIESNNLKINGDTTINGDLYVNGTTHTVESEDISATGDILTLRSNNPSSLVQGQVSGLVINNYDGNNNDLALVTDSEGTMRVGTGTGTDTNYTKIALKASDGLYYTYDDTVEPVTYTLLSPQPSGTLTAWTNKQERIGYTWYATATFTVIDETTLEPLATRAESSDMDNNGIVYWDSTELELKTKTPPVKKQVVLSSEDGIDFAPQPINGGVLTATAESAGSATYYTDGVDSFDINGNVVTPHSGTATTPSLIGKFYQNYSRNIYKVISGGVDFFYDNQFYDIASVQFTPTDTGMSYEITLYNDEYYAKIEDAQNPGTYIYWDTNNEFGSDWTIVDDAALLSILENSTYDTYYEYIEDYGMIGTIDNGTTWYQYSDFETEGIQIIDATISAVDAISISSYTVSWSASNDYSWEPMLGNYIFNTMADYNVAASSVPNGASVIILNESSYIKAE